MRAIRPGDLLFVRGQSFFGRAIRQVTGGHYNHVEVLGGPDLSIGAMEGQGVRTCNWRAAFVGEQVAICEAQAKSQAEASRVFDWVSRYSGKDYDNRAIPGVWLKFLLKRAHLQGLLRVNPINDDGKWYCSELASAGWQTEGLFKEQPASLWSPAELYEHKAIKLLSELQL